MPFSVLHMQSHDDALSASLSTMQPSPCLAFPLLQIREEVSVFLEGPRLIPITYPRTTGLCLFLPSPPHPPANSSLSLCSTITSSLILSQFSIHVFLKMNWISHFYHISLIRSGLFLETTTDLISFFLPFFAFFCIF